MSFARKPGRKVELEQISSVNRTTEVGSRQLGEDFEISSEMVTQVPQGGKVYMRVSRQKMRQGSGNSESTDKKSEAELEKLLGEDKVKE